MKCVIYIVKDESNILHVVNRRKANWIGHILRRNCLVKYLTDRSIEVTVRRGRRGKQLLDDVKETEGYCELEEEALGRTVSRTRFGRGWRAVLRQTTE